MTPKFKTPSFVKVTDAEKRKEVTEKLKELGYDKKYCNDLGVNGILCDLGNFYALKLDVPNFCNLSKCIDCGENVSLFLALAGMREDTDEGQWFIHKDVKTIFYQCDQTYVEHFFPRWHHKYRRATAEEIVEHFKTKEK